MQLPLAETPEVMLVAVAVLSFFFCLIFLSVFLFLVLPWIQALLSGEPVPLFHILGMRLRWNSPNLLIHAYIVLKKKGIDTSIAEVENIYIANKDRIRDYSDLVDRVQEAKSA